MKKFVLSSILGGALVIVFGVTAKAQQTEKLYRIGFLTPSSTAQTASFVEAFRQGLRELGYIEGKNFVLDIRGGGARRDRIINFASELVGLKPDVIVTAGPGVRIVKEATSTIPIVMAVGSDPVRRGLVASLAHPGGNITGLYSMAAELSGKRLELLLEVVPGIKRVAALTAVRDHTARDWYRELAAMARPLGVKLQVLQARDPSAIDNAFLAMIKERAEALVVIPNARYLQNRERIIEHGAKNRLPVIYDNSVYVEDGGLMSYGADFNDEFRRAATYVDKILKGRKPADLPMQRPTKFELVINVKTAKQIGLTIPQWTLMKADQVIK